MTSPSKPPTRCASWEGTDEVLAGAVLDCKFEICTSSSLNPTELLPFTTTSAHQSHKQVSKSLADPKLVKLAVNLFQLHGPFFCFRNAQCLRALGQVGVALKLVTRKREMNSWAAPEVLKLNSFCNGLRNLFRTKSVPTVLLDALMIDKDESERLANVILEKQGSGGFDKSSVEDEAETRPEDEAETKPEDETQDGEATSEAAVENAEQEHTAEEPAPLEVDPGTSLKRPASEAKVCDDAGTSLKRPASEAEVSDSGSDEDVHIMESAESFLRAFRQLPLDTASSADPPPKAGAPRKPAAKPKHGRRKKASSAWLQDMPKYEPRSTKSGHVVDCMLCQQRGKFLGQLRKDKKPAGLQVTASTVDDFKVVVTTVLYKAAKAYAKADCAMSKEALRSMRERLSST